MKTIETFFAEAYAGLPIFLGACVFFLAVYLVVVVFVLWPVVAIGLLMLVAILGLCTSFGKDELMMGKKKWHWRNK